MCMAVVTSNETITITIKLPYENCFYLRPYILDMLLCKVILIGRQYHVILFTEYVLFILDCQFENLYAFW